MAARSTSAPAIVLWCAVAGADMLGLAVVAAALDVAESSLIAAQLPTACRRDASPRSATSGHGPSRGSGRTSHCAAPLHTEHYSTDFVLRFPKPGVGCSIQPGGTTSMLHRALWCSGVRQQSFRIGRTADMLLTRTAWHRSERRGTVHAEAAAVVAAGCGSAHPSVRRRR